MVQKVYLFSSYGFLGFFVTKAVCNRKTGNVKILRLLRLLQRNRERNKRKWLNHAVYSYYLL